MFWKGHFTLKNIAANHDNPSIFIACQWQKDKTAPNKIYLLYRTIFFLIFVVTWMITIIRQSGTGKWPIFLTNWGYTGCTLQAFLAFFMLFIAVLASHFEKMLEVKTKVLKMYSVYWIVNTMTTPTAFAITVIYWCFVFNAKNDKLDAMNYFVHGNNTFLMLLDLLIVAHPIRILHVVYLMVMGFTYALFTYIYYAAGGTDNHGYVYIYEIVNWTNPGPTAGTCFGVVVFLVVLHLFVVLISYIRRILDEKCCSKRIEITTTDTLMKAAYVNEVISIEDV